MAQDFTPVIPTDDKIHITYWGDLRGTINPVVMLAEFLGLDYELHQIPCVFQAYLAQKKRYKDAGEKFCNLPFLYHKGKYVSETRAIAAYLCQVAGKTELYQGQKDVTEFLQLDGMQYDLFWEVTRWAYRTKTLEEFKAVYSNVAARWQERLGDLADLVEEREFVFGAPGYLDFQLAETVQKIEAIEKDLDITILSKNEKLTKFRERVYALDQIKAYRDGNKYNIIGFPWNPPMLTSWN